LLVWSPAFFLARFLLLSTLSASPALFAYGKSGQEDSNLRPHGPEPSGDATQGLTNSSDTQSPSPVYTPDYAAKPDNAKSGTVETLAAALLGLSPDDRARLAAMLLGEAK
jgi:hypothetical protein